MERITPTLPSGAGRLGELTREQRLQERIGTTMRASGLNETMTYSFADPADTERMRDVLDEGEVYCELLNPMSAEQAVLRRTMLPGLLRSVSYNQRRGVPDVHLYEIGSTFRMAPGRKQPKERAALAGVLAGAWHRPAWNEPAEPLGFFDGKGVIEDTRTGAGAQAVQGPRDRAAVPTAGSSCRGTRGRRGRGLARRRSIRSCSTASKPTARWRRSSLRSRRSCAEPPTPSRSQTSPASRRSISMWPSWCRRTSPPNGSSRRSSPAGGKLLESVRLFDVYRGKGVEPGKKSMAFELAYRAADRTLTTEEVESAHERLVRKVCGAVGGELRG